MAGTKLVLCGLVALSALAGCGGDKQEALAPGATTTQCAPGQYFDGRICQSQTGAAPTATPTATPTTAAPAGTVPSAIPGLPVATTTQGAAATPLDPAAAQVVTTLIGPLAASSAPPGAKPVGAAIAGNFTQGQTLEQTVQMNPGKCYTIVGVAIPTITDLNIQLVPSIALPGLPAAVVASDSTVGPQAIVGQTPNCYKWALPIGGTMKVVVTAAAGQGIAAAQVYEK